MEQQPKQHRYVRWQSQLPGPGDPARRQSLLVEEDPLEDVVEAKTDAEERFYRRCMEQRTPMVVVTRDGHRLKGWIEWYDRDVLKLHSLTEPNCFIAKDRIKYLYLYGEGEGEDEPMPTPPPLTSFRTRRRRGGQRRFKRGGRAS
ncbi:MAG: hypothetical protein ACE5ID_11565 [Acidobacteriota bacterium]